MTLRKNRGFTLVEILVVVSIIGVLMALLLPAIAAAREMSRRMLCSSQMRQITQMAITYEQRKQALPPSRYPPRDLQSNSNNERVYNWVHALLPDMDPNAAKQIEQFEFAGDPTNPSATLTADYFYAYPEVSVPLIKCPSDTFTDNPGFQLGTPIPVSPDAAETNALSYGINSGLPNALENQFPVNLPIDYPENGATIDRVVLTPGRPRFQMSVADITNGDGSTNTILFGENVNLINWREAPGSNHPWQRSPSDPVPNNRWVDFGMQEHQFHVGIVWLPNPVIGLNRDLPDTPGFSNSPLDANHARPGSYHPNGFVMSFADGSVRFVSDSIQYDVYARLMTSNGRRARDPNNPNLIPNPVWGAMQATPIKDGDY